MVVIAPATGRTMARVASVPVRSAWTGDVRDDVVMHDRQPDRIRAAAHEVFASRMAAARAQAGEGRWPAADDRSVVAFPGRSLEAAFRARAAQRRADTARLSAIAAELRAAEARRHHDHGVKPVR